MAGPELKRHREDLVLRALVWAVENLRPCPQSYDSKGHPMGWVPSEVELWEEDRAAVLRILADELATRSVPAASPAELLFTEPVTVAVDASSTPAEPVVDVSVFTMAEGAVVASPARSAGRAGQLERCTGTAVDVGSPCPAAVLP